MRWHKFKASANLDGRPIDVVLTVRELKDGSYHYALNTDQESIAGGGGFSSPESAGRRKDGSQGLTALEGATGDDLNIARAIALDQPL